jgi:signal transduction histidine kinase
MNRSQKKLAMRLQLMLIVPIAVGTTLLITLSTARRHGALAAHNNTPSAELIARIMREEIVSAVVEGVVLMIVVVAIVSWFARTLARELSAIVAAADRIGAHDFSQRVAVESKLGLERVPEAFNAMAAQLEASEAALSKATEKAEAFNERLAHAQSLAAVGQVAASIAHEVGSPLNAILVNARMAAEDEACPPHTRRSLEEIATQSDRIGTVLRRMLQLSQPPDESTGSCDARAVMQEIFHFVGGLLRKSKVEGAIDAPAAALPVAMRAEHLQQALFNLIVNAVQEQQSGGRVVLAARREGDRARIEVRDAGSGVADEDIAHLWDPFFTRKRERGGTGLGLPVVKSLVERVGGSVNVERAREGGACFVLWLPLAKD